MTGASRAAGPAIGGYFGLELRAGREWHDAVLRFQSARAAFLALLLAGRPPRVWLPWHICDAMLEPPHAANIPVARYALDATLGIPADLSLAPGDWLLYVNYFGVCSEAARRTLAQFPPDQIVIDNAQAFFAPPLDCLATLYSPRKFFGVPDGGYLATRLPVPAPDTADDGSIDRCVHLLKRLATAPEAGLADYRTAEDSLAGQTPQRMSALTRRLLESVDYAGARSQRTANFAVLHDLLAPLNRFPFSLENVSAPLSYPFWTEAGAQVRARLAAQRIFIPTYWPGDNPRQLPVLERRLRQECLPLPCDQRYDAADMQRLAATLLEVLKGNP